MDGDDNASMSTNKLIDMGLNLIAPRVIGHLEEKRHDGGKRIVGKRVQPEELSMLLWSYAMAKRKDCPPGGNCLEEWNNC